MHERRFSGDIERLRSSERIDRLEVPRVIQLCLDRGDYINMLDVGTGSGLIAEEFEKQGLDIAGIDVNFEMLPVARGYIPSGSFVQATAEALPFTDKSFDLIFYGLVLHEADDLLGVIRSARRVSRKLVCILEWPYRDQPFGPPLADRLSPSRLDELFVEAGFSTWKREQLTNLDLYRLSA